MRRRGWTKCGWSGKPEAVEMKSLYSFLGNQVCDIRKAWIA
jgi:hypothetical protein